MSTKTVAIYDSETKQITQIPAAELAPGMVKVRIDGVGEVFVREETINPSEKRNELPDGFAPIALAVLKIVGTWMSWVKSEDDWVNGFRADAHPVRELVRWMHTASVYHEMTHGGTDPEPVAHDVFNVLVSSMNDGAQALDTIQLSRISPSRAKAVVARHQQAEVSEDFVEFWADRVDLDTLLRLRNEEEGSG